MNTTQSDLYLSYMRGWFTGAGHKPIDPKFEKHLDEHIKSAYFDGWADGRYAGRVASDAASKRFGYTPSIIRAMNL